MSVIVIDNPKDLRHHVAAWEELAAAALEPNAFYEPWLLLPAIRAFGGGQRLLFALVYKSDPRRPGADVLCGFFPLRRRRHRALRVSMVQLWSHDYCFLCTPLLRAGHAREALAAFADWLAADPRAGTVIEYGAIVGEGPFHRVLVDHLRERGQVASLASCHTRAFFRPRSNAEEYLHTVLSGDQRRELRRREKRLAESRAMEYRELAPADDVDTWAESFLDLEAAGWKGREKTAMGCDPASREFFLTAAREGARRGQLLMHALYHAGRPIAMRCSFIAGEGAFFFKPAYDEEYARHTPGVLLEIEAIRRLHGHPRVRWMDSCTAWDNHMMNRIWIDRRVIQTVVVAADERVGSLAVSLLPLVRWLKNSLGATKGSLWHWRQPNPSPAA